MRNMLFASICIAGFVPCVNADDKPKRSIDEDRKAFTESIWVNKNPDGAWKKLTPEQQKLAGGKAWNRLILDTAVLDERTAKLTGMTHAVILRKSVGDEKFPGGGAIHWIKLTEEDTKRYLSIPNEDKIEHKIEYEFRGDVLTLKGTYFEGEKSSRIWPVPEVFDGEYKAEPRSTLRQPARISRSFSGFLDDAKLLELAPQSQKAKRFHIASAEEFAALWKGWRPKEKLPDIDFTMQLVCILAAESADPPEIKPELDGDGDLLLFNQAKQNGKKGFGYRIIVIGRVPVKKVAGVKLN